MSNVPKLRFPEFVGEWEKEKARNIFFSISDKNHSGELPVISVTQNRGTVARQDLNIDIKYDKTNLINYKRIRLNNFVISLRSFQGGIDRSNHDGLVSPAYTIFDFIKSDRHNPHFFEHIFKSKNFINRLVTLIYGIRDGKAIGFTDFSSLNVSVPLKAEQTKIANFFALIDKKITKQDDKVAALEQYKKGLMQKIFSHEIRFKDDNGKGYPEWEAKRLKDLGSISSGVGFSETYQGLKGLEVSVFKVSDMNLLGNNKHMVKANNTVSLETCKIMKTKPVNGPAIIFAKVGAAIFLERKRIVTNIFLVDNNMMYLIPKKNASVEFIYYLLNNTRLSKLSQVGALPSYNASDIGIIKVNIPTLPEQTKIANFLSLYDRRIEKEKAKLEALREQKKGLLQQMFV